MATASFLGTNAFVLIADAHAILHPDPGIVYRNSWLFKGGLLDSPRAASRTSQLRVYGLDSPRGGRVTYEMMESY
jgi:hypothetical protein